MFILTGGERHDMSQAESLLAPFHFDAVIADKGYHSDPLRNLLAAQQVETAIPSRAAVRNLASVIPGIGFLMVAFREDKRRA